MNGGGRESNKPGKKRTARRGAKNSRDSSGWSSFLPKDDNQN